MNKENFLINIRETIKENPSWTGESIIAITQGLLRYEMDITRQVNVFWAALVLLTPKDRKRIISGLSEENVKLLGLDGYPNLKKELKK